MSAAVQAKREWRKCRRHFGNPLASSQQQQQQHHRHEGTIAQAGVVEYRIVLQQAPKLLDHGLWHDKLLGRLRLT